MLTPRLSVCAIGAAMMLLSAGAAMAQSTSTGSRSSGTSATSSNASATLSAADRRMMQELAQANNAEIALSQLAEERSKNPKVQTFARKMVEDHRQAATELSKLAQDKGVNLPTELDRKHQDLQKRLSGLSGTRFDEQYMSQTGTHDHQSTLALLQRIDKQSSDPDLKALAQKLIPTVEQHLETAREKTK